MPGDGFLHKYFLNNPSKKLHKWVHYFDIYERHFERFRGKPITMIEIGVDGGGSLEMWKGYFGPDSKIIGIDLHPPCKQHENPVDNIHVYIGSQDDKGLMDSILKEHGSVDVVLDDGGHQMAHMIASFKLLYEHVAKDGVYMVEDVHTSYWPDFDGGVGRDGTFMEFVKTKLDEINAVHTHGALPISSFTRSTQSITCYDSIVVFEKRPQGSRQAPITEGMG